MSNDPLPAQPVPNIVCFGEVLIDMLAQPASEGRARAFEQYAGGAPANVAVAAARLGVRSEFVGMLGRDMFGDFLHEELVQAGVGVGFTVRTEAAKTALAFVALDATGDRSFSFYRPPAADLLFREEHFDDACLSQADIFHFCSNSLTDPAYAQATFSGALRARKAGAVVSCDLNLRPALWPADVDPTPTLWQALELADVVKLSREELQFLAQTPLSEPAVIQRLLEARAQLVVVTDGPGDVVWTTRHTHGRVTPFKVTVADTTAAGDAFVAGLLVRLAELGGVGRCFADFCGDAARITQAVRFGIAVSGLVVTRKGAFAAMPSRQDVLSFAPGIA